MALTDSVSKAWKTSCVWGKYVSFSLHSYGYFIYKLQSVILIQITKSSLLCWWPLSLGTLHVCGSYQRISWPGDRGGATACSLHEEGGVTDRFILLMVLCLGSQPVLLLFPESEQQTAVWEHVGNSRTGEQEFLRVPLGNRWVSMNTRGCATEKETELLYLTQEMPTWENYGKRCVLWDSGCSPAVEHMLSMWEALILSQHVCIHTQTHTHTCTGIYSAIGTETGSYYVVQAGLELTS